MYTKFLPGPSPEMLARALMGDNQQMSAAGPNLMKSQQPNPGIEQAFRSTFAAARGGGRRGLPGQQYPQQQSDPNQPGMPLNITPIQPNAGVHTPWEIDPNRSRVPMWMFGG